MPLITGTGGNDTLYGTNADDTIQGLADNDWLEGGAGNDSIVGGSGDDNLDGGTGSDTLIGGAGDDTFVRASVIVFSGKFSDYVMAPFTGYSWFTITDKLASRDGADRIIGGATLRFIDGDHSLAEIFGVDVVPSKEGDLLLGGSVGDLRYGLEGADTIRGFGGDDTLYGGDGNDSIDGSDGADLLFGEEGNDTIDAGTGDNYVDGGAGIDTVRFASSAIGVYVDLAATGSWMVGVENLVGSTNGDELHGDAGANVMDGSDGNDTISGEAGADTLVGGSGEDWIYSGSVSPPFNAPYFDSVPAVLPLLDTGAENDSLSGGAGDDRLFAGYGDSVDGGAYEYVGNSLYISFMGALQGVQADFRQLDEGGTVTIGGGSIKNIQNVHWIEGSNFDDLLAPSNGNGYTNFGPVYGMGGNDHIISGYYTGLIDGGDGNDLIEAEGAQYGFPVIGGAGDDTILGAYGRIDGGDGNDSITGGNEVAGGAGDDFIRTTGQTISAGAGNDTLVGYGGSQLLDGGDGNDAIHGDDDVGYNGNGNDTIMAGAGDDTVWGDTLNDSIDGGSGNDTLVFKGNFSEYSFNYDRVTQKFIITDTIEYREGSDEVAGVEAFQFNDGTHSAASVAAMFGSALNDTFNGSGGADTFFGLAGSDSLLGGAGNDTLSGGLGNDYLDGGDGIDTASYQDQSIGVTVNLSVTAVQPTSGAGNDTLLHFENLTGGSGDDSLTGDPQANLIMGGAGNDTIDSAGGADTLNGGAGWDAYIIRSGSETLIESAGGGSGVDSVTAFASFALPENVENLTLGGTSAIDGTGNSADNAIAGNAAANSIDGGDGFDTITGSAGSDTLSGGGASDSIAGNDGDDFIAGAEGDDIMMGGSGADTVQGGVGQDTLYSFEQSPPFQRPYFNNPGNPPLLDTGTERDSLDGGAGDDELFAGAGDSVDGGTFANIGNKLYISFMGAAHGVNADFRPIQSGGTATIDGATIQHIQSVEWLQGSDYDDVLAPVTWYYSNFGPIYGMGGNDSIVAGYYTGWIDGGDGNDTIDATGGAYGFPVSGGAGDDLLLMGTGDAHGGAGVDTAVFSRDRASYSFGWDANGRILLVDYARIDGVELFSFRDGDFLLWQIMPPTQGTSAADAMTGTPETDVVQGLAGNDTLTGLDGDDYLDGGAGNDVINGGNGRDTAMYSGITAVKVDLSIAGAQDTGGAGVDTLSSIENVNGGDGNDTLTGNAAANQLDGGAGNDTLDGGAGVDTLKGGSGDDLYAIDGTGDQVVESDNGGNDTFTSDVVSLALANLNIENAVLAGAKALDAAGNASDNRLVGNAAPNLLQGFGNNDLLQGAAGQDTLDGGTGSDTLDGGDGIDVARFSGNVAEYTLSRTVTGFEVSLNSSVDDFDTLTNVERLLFADAQIAIDITGNAGKAYRLYQAAFDREPDIPGLGFQMHALDSGLTLSHVAGDFIASPEFQSKYGNVDNAQFVSLLYQHVLHRTPQQFEIDFHVDNELLKGYSRADVLTFFSESPENQANVIGDIADGMTYVW